MLLRKCNSLALANLRRAWRYAAHMARAHRVEYEGAYYHVMNRGRGRQTIFHDILYYQFFLDCLEQACKRFGLEVHAYCLMGNHYHLLVRTPRGNLSRAMRHVNGVYTQTYNRLKRSDGPLFRGRYTAINIESSSYLLEVSRYIHRNPVEMRRPLVSELIAYPWSSYRAYRNKEKAPPWLEKDVVLAELGSGQPTAAYGRFVASGLDEETAEFYAKGNWPAIRGSKAFAESAYLKSLSIGPGISEERPVVDFDRIVEAVVLNFGCDRKSILQGRRGRGNKQIERWMAMKLAQDFSGESLIRLSERFGVGHYGTVSVTISRLTKLMQEDAEVRARFNSISRALTP